MPKYLGYLDETIRFITDSGNDILDFEGEKRLNNTEIITITDAEYNQLMQNGNEYFKIRNKKIIEKDIQEKKDIDDIKNLSKDKIAKLEERIQKLEQSINKIQ